MTQNKCLKCHDTGKVPLIKHGKLIPYAWVYCDCREPERETHHTVTPDMFDYPMSSDFRAFSYEYCNQPDLGYIPPEPEAPPPQIIEHRHSDMSQKDYVRLQNLEGQVKYLQGKMMEREKKKEDFY